MFQIKMDVGNLEHVPSVEKEEKSSLIENCITSVTDNYRASRNPVSFCSVQNLHLQPATGKHFQNDDKVSMSDKLSNNIHTFELSSYQRDFSPIDDPITYSNAHKGDEYSTKRNINRLALEWQSGPLVLASLRFPQLDSSIILLHPLSLSPNGTIIHRIGSVTSTDTVMSEPILQYISDTFSLPSSDKISAFSCNEAKQHQHIRNDLIQKTAKREKSNSNMSTQGTFAIHSFNKCNDEVEPMFDNTSISPNHFIDHEMSSQAAQDHVIIRRPDDTFKAAMNVSSTSSTRDACLSQQHLNCSVTKSSEEALTDDAQLLSFTTKIGQGCNIHDLSEKYDSAGIKKECTFENNLGILSSSSDNIANFNTPEPFHSNIQYEKDKSCCHSSSIRERDMLLDESPGCSYNHLLRGSVANRLECTRYYNIHNLKNMANNSLSNSTKSSISMHLQDQNETNINASFDKRNDNIDSEKHLNDLVKNSSLILATSLRTPMGCTVIGNFGEKRKHSLMVNSDSNKRCKRSFQSEQIFTPIEIKSVNNKSTSLGRKSIIENNNEPFEMSSKIEQRQCRRSKSYSDSDYELLAKEFPKDSHAHNQVLKCVSNNGVGSDILSCVLSDNIISHRFKTNSSHYYCKSNGTHKKSENGANQYESAGHGIPPNQCVSNYNRCSTRTSYTVSDYF